VAARQAARPRAQRGVVMPAWSVRARASSLAQRQASVCPKRQRHGSLCLERQRHASVCPERQRHVSVCPERQRGNVGCQRGRCDSASANTCPERHRGESKSSAWQVPACPMWRSGASACPCKSTCVVWACEAEPEVSRSRSVVPTSPKRAEVYLCTKSVPKRANLQPTRAAASVK